MAAILLDHNVSRDFIALLAGRGHRARSARDIWLDRADDSLIVLHAAEQRWIIITHNGTDFSLLHSAWHRWAAAWRVTPPPHHSGILIIPQRQHLTHEHLALRVVELLAQQPDLSNRLYEWTVSRGWVLDEIF